MLTDGNKLQYTFTKKKKKKDFSDCPSGETRKGSLKGSPFQKGLKSRNLLKVKNPEEICVCVSIGIKYILQNNTVPDGRVFEFWTWTILASSCDRRHF